MIVTLVQLRRIRHQQISNPLQRSHVNRKQNQHIILTVEERYYCPHVRFHSQRRQSNCGRGAVVNRILGTTVQVPSTWTRKLTVVRALSGLQRTKVGYTPGPANLPSYLKNKGDYADGADSTLRGRCSTADNLRRSHRLNRSRTVLLCEKSRREFSAVYSPVRYFLSTCILAHRFYQRLAKDVGKQVATKKKGNDGVHFNHVYLFLDYIPSATTPPLPTTCRYS